ncbi:porin [Labrys monachus]|uniref:Porin n=1 Tax=Labrys monachus TaxID=217067 RepID=A0ABU0FHR8_9HYPH|nr:porin [Labrys monachus]MDQ0394151.1 opacity protein-like surface antigen [Labrys monachus]
MTMKSLLLGAAAGIATIGAAQAADLPMTKAEPVEYVKVCSEFGPGFFYIPGTDSCLKIAGNYRADYTFNSLSSRPYASEGTTSKRSLGQTSFQGRAQISFDVRTDTDYGLLRSYLLLDAATGTSNGQSWQVGNVSGSKVYVDKAYIQFGGLTAGYAETFYAFYDNYYGDTFFAPYFGSGGTGTKQLLAYTAQFGGGFSATLSIEDPAAYRGGIGNSSTATNTGAKTPNFIANVLYDGAWGKAQIMGALHQTDLINIASSSDTSSHSKWGFAVGAGVSINIPALAGGYIALEGDYADGANAFTGVADNQYSPAGAPNAYDAYWVNGGLKTAKSWAVTGEAGFNITPQLKAMLFGSYGHYDAPSVYNDFTAYQVGAQLSYAIVKNLTIGAEVYYANTKSDSEGNNIVAGEGVTLQKAKTDSIVGGVRIIRTF